MKDNDFVDAMKRLVEKNGIDALLGSKAKAYVYDYKGSFDKEAARFIEMLEANCATYINEADNVLERKWELVKRMDIEHGISPKFSMPLLDLLGLLLRGDTSIIAKTVEEQKAEENARIIAEAQAEAEAKRKAEAEAKVIAADAFLNSKSRFGEAKALTKTDANDPLKNSVPKITSPVTEPKKSPAPSAPPTPATPRTSSKPSKASGKIKVNITAVVFGAVIGAAVLGILPGFGFIRLCIGAAAGLLLGIFVNRNDVHHGFFYSHSDGLFVFALIATILFTIVGGLLGISGMSYRIFWWGAFCLTMLIIFKVKSDDFTIRGEGLANFACLALVIAGSVYLFFTMPPANKPEPSADALEDAAQIVIVTPDALNLRANASGDSDIIKILYKGNALIVTGVAVNGWLPVEHEGSSGWVGAQYVSAAGQTPAAAAQTQNAQPAAAASAPDQAIPQANQTAVSEIDATEFRGKDNQQFQFYVTGTNYYGSVWGSGTYTDDSNIAKAAVHAGKIRDGQTGWVTIKILPGQKRYQGTTANGVESIDYGSWHGSFMFE